MVAVGPPQRREKKLHERDLIERLKKYEALMSKHGIDFESVLNDEDENAGLDITDPTELKTARSGQDYTFSTKDYRQYVVLHLILLVKSGRLF